MSSEDVAANERYINIYNYISIKIYYEKYCRSQKLFVLEGK